MGAKRMARIQLLELIEAITMALRELELVEYLYQLEYSSGFVQLSISLSIARRLPRMLRGDPKLYTKAVELRDELDRLAKWGDEVNEVYEKLGIDGVKRYVRSRLYSMIHKTTQFLHALEE